MPPKQDLSGYQYSAMSSLVLSADRSNLPRRDQEPDGAPETLVGRIDPRDMGSRATRETLKKEDKEKRKKATGHANAEQDTGPSKRSRRGGPSGARDIVAATEELEGLTYKPTNNETREVYEMILNVSHNLLGDQPADVVRSATDLIIGWLKDDNLKDFDRRKEVEGLVGKIETDTYTELVNLGKKISDYATEDDAQKQPDQEMGGDGEIDETGVAVVFDEEEDGEGDDDDNDQDGEGGGDGFEAYEGSEDESDQDEQKSIVASDEEDGLVIGQSGEEDGKKSSSTKDRVHARDIDGFWLQRLIGTHYEDAQNVTNKTGTAFDLLSSDASTRDVENDLINLFDYDHFDTVKLLVKNRDIIVWCTKLARATEDDRVNIEVAMREKGFGYILKELSAAADSSTNDNNKDSNNDNNMEIDQKQSAVPKKANLAPGSLVAPRKAVDLDSMAFSQGSRLMTNKKVSLPEKSFKRSKKGYEEIHIPAPEPARENPDEQVKVSDMPQWIRPAFEGIQKLRPIQSRIYPVAFDCHDKDEEPPMLVCAPTGAGKTNIALLTMLKTISNFRDEETGQIDLDAFKIVYIAPMKALVQEMVGSFGEKLAPFGIKVAELSGDRSLTKQQIAETQVIFTTPEKWDVITRKSTDTSYTNLVRLVIIDEIHLLHDERGPVLESIVARTIRRMEQTQEPVRLVGLSATLPNYKDVANFLRVDPKVGLFYFDSTYRPVPLKMEFVGVTEKRAITRLQTMNEICYEKVLEKVSEGNQVLIFVHSRKETAKTAHAIKDLLIERGTIDQVVGNDLANREILQKESEDANDSNLKDLLRFGFAIHHAGMNRVDRSTVEDLFGSENVKVLVSTATLAWGVNLPAYAAIIKGTQIYNPEKGRWVELSPQDVLQMLGRAGRPGRTTQGEGIIITNHSELQFYLSIMTASLPIESQLVGQLPDSLNAEICQGTIRNRDEAVAWLGYTYWFQRALVKPSLYGINADYQQDDRYLVQKRADIIHTAAAMLEKAGLVKYERKSGILTPTEAGKIASNYYVTHTTMATYQQHLRPTVGLIELFRIFALSDEFKHIPIRPEEKLELTRLIERVPIPVKESLDEPIAKVNVLLQAYISNLRLDAFALLADMVYVTASAGRLLRCIFEVCLKRGWAALTHRALELCKMADRKMWNTMSPLRQFPNVPLDVVRRAERKEFPWYRYFDLEPVELGELLGLPKAGRLVHKLVHQFPKFELQANIQPITRSLLRVELTITPDFIWDEKVHGNTENFWILAEDVDGERILFYDQFQLRQRYATEDHYVTFTVEMSDPPAPNYFISITSDRWLHSETRLPVSFKHLILPEKFPNPTALLDLQPLPISAFKNPAYEKIYKPLGSRFNDDVKNYPLQNDKNPFAIRQFNKIQTQVFQALYFDNENCFIGAPAGSGKTICAEFAILRHWSQQDYTRIVCIEPYQEVVDLFVDEWSRKFGKSLNKKIVSLTGDVVADLSLLNNSDLIVCTPNHWDMLSRRWKMKQRRAVQEVGLFIADEVHLIGGSIGPTYEVCIARARYIAAQTGNPTRIVALGVSLANARELGEWIGASKHTIFNFPPSARPLPLEVHLQSFNVPHFPSLMIQMAKPAYLAITEWATDEPVICFVPSRRQCTLTANDLLSYALADEDPKRFIGADDEAFAQHLEHIQDADLKECLASGIGFYHEGLSKRDRKIVEQLYRLDAFRVLVASKDTAWSIPLSAHMVILMGVQSYEGREHRYVDYPLTDVLQMIGRACRPGARDQKSRAILMIPQVRKQFFLKFLNEGLPIESHLHLQLADHFNAEVVSKIIEEKQHAVDWLTWTYYFRRLPKNPNYYNMHGQTQTHLSDHLSELVENTLAELENTKCISIEDDVHLSPLNLGMISAYYGLSSITMDTFSLSLTDKTKLKGLLEIITAANEFEDIPIRHREDEKLKRLYDRLPVKMANPDFESPHVKANILLQAHFSRLPLFGDLVVDQNNVLTRVLNLLSASVDVLSSSGYLNAIKAMELSQMCVQAVWDKDSPLKQIPHFTSEVLKRCEKAEIDSVYDLTEMEDDDRNELLKFNNRQMQDLSKFVEAYPSMSVEHEVEDEDELSAGAPIVTKVQLERELDEDEVDKQEFPVMAPFFPVKKNENWWVVIGEPSTKQLLAIKKVPWRGQISKLSLEYTLPQGEHSLALYVISDSYAGVDQEIEFKVKVAEGEDSDEEDESEEDEDEEGGQDQDTAMQE